MYLNFPRFFFLLNSYAHFITSFSYTSITEFVCDEQIQKTNIKCLFSFRIKEHIYNLKALIAKIKMLFKTNSTFSVKKKYSNK